MFPSDVPHSCAKEEAGAHRKQLLAIVATMLHQRGCEPEDKHQTELQVYTQMLEGACNANQNHTQEPR